MKKNTKSFIMGVAFFCTTVLEAAEELESGKPVLDAVNNALTRKKVREKAMKKASREAAKRIAMLEQEEP